MKLLILLTGSLLCAAQELSRLDLTQDNAQSRSIRPIASSGNDQTGQYSRGGQAQQSSYPVYPEQPYSQPAYPQVPPHQPQQPYYPEPQQPYVRPDEVDSMDLFPNPSQPEDELPEFSVVQPPLWTAGTPPPPPEPYRPPPSDLITPPPTPVETTTEKVGYEINFCDKQEFPESTLEAYHLKKLDYFIYNASCSQIFFQCSNKQTFLLKCPSADEAFDVATSNCNFRNSIKYCPEYDHVIHCTIRDQCSQDEFACCSLPQKCLPLTKRCDGHQDCSDGDDENNCPSCQRDEFACVKSGQCIPATQRCDGNHDDCQDGTNMDEIGCSKNSTCVGKFMCHQSFEGPSCIDYSMHCDGTKDCDNGEDEINCRVSEAKYILCENQKQQVLRSNWCDGEEHCADGSDEKYCY